MCFPEYKRTGGEGENERGLRKGHLVTAPPVSRSLSNRRSVSHTHTDGTVSDNEVMWDKAAAAAFDTEENNPGG